MDPPIVAPPTTRKTATPEEIRRQSLRRRSVQILKRYESTASMSSNLTTETGLSYGATTLGSDDEGEAARFDAFAVRKPRNSINSVVGSEVTEDDDDLCCLMLYTNEVQGPKIVDKWKPMFQSRGLRVRGRSLRTERVNHFNGSLRNVRVVLFLLSSRRSRISNAIMKDPNFKAFLDRVLEIPGVRMVVVKLPVKNSKHKLDHKKIKVPMNFPSSERWIEYCGRGAKQEEMKRNIWDQIFGGATNAMLTTTLDLGLPTTFHDTHFAEMETGTRGWLLEEFSLWRKDPKDGVFAVIGYFGMGKSAFINSIARTYRKDIVAQVRVIKDSPDGHGSVKRVIQFIYNQLCSNIPALNSKKKKKVAMEDMFEKQQEERQLQLESVESLFTRFISVPTQKLDSPGPKMILIDGFDQYNHSTELAELLQLITRWQELTPSWLTLVVTSSPAYGIPEALSIFNVVTLSFTDERNIDDIRSYAARRLMNVNKGVEKVVDESQGWFMYANNLVGMMMERTQVQAGEDEAIMEVLNALSHEELVPRMKGHYKRHFQRLHKFCTDNELDYSLIVAPIAAARTALPLRIWRELTNIPIMFESSLKQYFAINGGNIQLLHSSMRAWIDTIDSGNLKVPVFEGHQSLAEWCWRHETKRQSKLDVSDSNVNPNEERITEEYVDNTKNRKKKEKELVVDVLEQNENPQNQNEDDLNQNEENGVELTENVLEDDESTGGGVVVKGVSEVNKEKEIDSDDEKKPELDEVKSIKSASVQQEETHTSMNVEMVQALELKKQDEALSSKFTEEQVIYHLCMSGRFRDAEKFILNFHWLLNRIRLDGIEQVLYDAEEHILASKRRQIMENYRELRNPDPIEFDVHIVVAALRLSRQVLKRDYSLLPSQLLSRIGIEDLDNTALLTGAKHYKPGGPWWRPLRPSLFRAGLEVQQVWTRPNTQIYAESGFLGFDVAPDGDRIVVGCLNAKVCCYRVDTGVLVYEKLEHSDGVCTIKFTKDGLHFASASWDGVILLWRANTGDVVRTLDDAHTDIVWGLCFPNFSADYLLSCSQDGTVREFRKDYGSQVLVDLKQGIGDMDLSRLGELLLAADDNIIHVHSVTSGIKTREYKGHTNTIRRARFSNNEKLIASGGADPFMIIWRADSEQKLCTINCQGDGEIVSLCFNLTDDQIFAGSDSLLRQWEIRGKVSTLLRKLSGHSQPLTEVILAPLNSFGKQHLMSVGFDEALIVWSPEEQPLDMQYPETKEPEVVIGTSTVSPMETYLITSYKSGTIKVWLLETGEVVKTFDDHDTYMDRIACSPDEKSIACGTRRARHPVRVWDLETGELKFEVEVGQLGAMLFSWDSQWLGITSNVLGTHTYNVADGSLQKEFVFDEDGLLRTLSFSPGNKYFLGASERETAVIWDTDSGEVIHRLNLTVGGAADSAFSPDGKHFAILTDTRAYLWECNLETGEFKKKGVLFLLLEEVHLVALAFTKDGKYIAAMTEDGDKMMVWDVETERLVEDTDIYSLDIASTSSQSVGVFAYPLMYSKKKDKDGVPNGEVTYDFPVENGVKAIGFAVDALPEFCEQYVTLSKRRAFVIQGHHVHIFEHVTS